MKSEDSTMNHSIAAALVIALVSLTYFDTAPFAFAEDLHVTVTPVSSVDGRMFYALYDSEESFKNSDQQYQAGKAPVQVGQTEIDLTDVTPGFYAFTVFQDLNNDGKLDTDIFGRPTEPFGISNITKTLYSFPKWNDVKFEVVAGQVTALSILLK
jgi:uncharacterized protein (DUF2141 family)